MRFYTHARGSPPLRAVLYLTRVVPSPCVRFPVHIFLCPISPFTDRPRYPILCVPFYNVAQFLVLFSPPLPLAGIGTGYSLMTGRLYDAQQHLPRVLVLHLYIASSTPTYPA